MHNIRDFDDMPQGMFSMIDTKTTVIKIRDGIRYWPALESCWMIPWLWQYGCSLEIQIMSRLGITTTSY